LLAWPNLQIPIGILYWCIEPLDLDVLHEANRRIFAISRNLKMATVAVLLAFAATGRRSSARQL
jgi:hypothetical protein